MALISIDDPINSQSLHLDGKYFGIVIFFVFTHLFLIVEIINIDGVWSINLNQLIVIIRVNSYSLLV